MEATQMMFSDPMLVAMSRSYMNERRLSVTELADRTDINRSMLSQYLNDKYQKPESVETKLRPFLEEQGVLKQEAEDDGDPFMLNLPGTRFFKSADAKGVAAMCSLAHQHALLNVVIGKSGHGKTHTLKQYAELPKVAYIECDDTMERRDLVDALELALGMNQSLGSISKRTDAIVQFLNSNPGRLVIVDEADKLISRNTQKKMAILRKLFDKAHVGIVISGEPQLEPLLKSYDERMANRGSYIYRLGGLTREEVTEYLSVFPLEKAAREVFIDRACGGRSGCFRLLDRTLTNVIRLMQERGENIITLELVEAARDMMIL